MLYYIELYYVMLYRIILYIKDGNICTDGTSKGQIQLWIVISASS